MGWALALRMVRLGALYALLCAALLAALLAWRSGLESGWGQRPGAFAQSAPAAVGVTVELLDAPSAEQQRALERLAAAGIDWVRIRAGWESIEPAPGVYEWQPLDALLANVSAAGLEPLLVLDGSPPWARSLRDAGDPAAKAPPADPHTFATFAAAVAGRYGALVQRYQIWDEPNIAPNWGNHQIDPVGYAQLLRTAAPALRSADPGAQLLSAALAPTRDRGHLAIDEVHFLQRMIAAGAVGSFDAVALQPFGFGDGPTISRQGVQRLNFQRLAVVRRTLVAAGLADMPIWAVRLGWNTRNDSPWGTVTPADQRRYAAETRAVADGWPWLAGLGWAVDQPATHTTDPAWGFALDDALLAAWSAAPVPLSEPNSGPPPAALLALALLAVAATLTLGAREVVHLPWRAWAARWHALPAWAQAAGWAAALGGYYLATWPPLTGFWLLALATLACAQPRTALGLTALLLPFHRFHKDIALPGGLTPYGHLSMAPMVAGALVLAPALLLGVRRLLAIQPRPSLRSLRWSDWLALGWLLLALPPAFNIWHWGGYGQGLVELVLAPLLLYAAARLVVRTPQQARTLALALVAGGVAAALLGLAKWAAGSGVAIDGVLRLVGPHDSPNHSALVLLRALVAGAGLLLAFAGGRRKLLAALLLPVAVALLLTASRGALLLGLPAGGAALLGFWLMRSAGPMGARLQRLFARRGVRAAAAAALLMVLAALLFGEARLLNQQSVDSRLQVWQAAAALWRARPLAGVGPGGFVWNYPAFLPLGATAESTLLHPHTVWLELATGWGVGGLLWLAALLGLWLWKGAQALRGQDRAGQGVLVGLTAALLAALAHAQVDAFLSLPDLAGWLFVALACVAVCTQPTARPTSTQG